MKARTLLYLVFFLFVLPVHAHADWDYYTYGAFDQVADSFERLALIYTDNRYSSLVGVMLIIGVTVAVISIVTKQAGPGKLILPFIGGTIFMAAIVPTDTIHVYDPTVNRYEAVGDVPALIAMGAGVTNLIERSITETVSQNPANPGTPERQDLGLKMLIEAAKQAGNGPNDHYNMRTLVDYFTSCGDVAGSVPGSTYSSSDLRGGLIEPMDAMEAMALQGAYTTAYSASAKSGVSRTCKDTWDNQLKPWLTSSGTLNGILSSLCRTSEYDPSVAAEFQSCRAELARAAETSTGINGVNLDRYLQNRIIANGIYQAINTNNPEISIEQLVNRQVTSESIGAAISAQSWMPTLRGSVVGITFGIIPIVLAFMVTPLIYKTFLITMGLFMFTVFWGVIDSYLYTAALDQYARVFTEAQQYGMGLINFWLTPSDSMKALSILTQSRGNAIMIATFLSASLFGLSAYGLSQIAQSYNDATENKGKQESEKQYDPVSNSNYVDSLAQAQAGAQAEGQFGMAGMRDANLAGRAESIAGTSELKNQTGMGAADAGASLGEISGGTRAGNLNETQKIAEQTGQSAPALAAQTSATETASRIGDASGTEKAAETMMNGDSFRMAEMNKQIEAERATGGNKTWSDMADTMVEQNPGMSKEQAWENLAKMDNSTYATFQATGGNEDTINRLIDINGERSVNEPLAFDDGMKELGSSTAEGSRAEGMSRAAQAAASDKAIGEEGLAASAATSYVGQKQAIADMRETLETASENGGLDRMQEQIAEGKVSQEYGRALAGLEAANAMGMSPVNSERSQNLSSITVPVTAEQAGDFFDRGIIDAQQHNTLSESGGTLTFALDPVHGEGSVTSQVMSGDSAVRNDSLSRDSSVNIDSSVSENDQYRRSTGADVGSGSGNVFEALQEPSTVQRVLEDDGGDYIVAENLSNAMSSVLNTDLSVQNSRALNTSIGVSAGPGGKGGKNDLQDNNRDGSAGGGSGSTGLFGGYSENAVTTRGASANIMTASFVNAIGAMREQARSEGYDTPYAENLRTSELVSEFADSMQKGTFATVKDEADGESVNDAIQEYFDSKGYNVASESIDSETSWFGNSSGIKEDTFTKE